MIHKNQNKRGINTICVVVKIYIRNIILTAKEGWYPL